MKNGYVVVSSTGVIFVWQNSQISEKLFGQRGIWPIFQMFKAGYMTVQSLSQKATEIELFIEIHWLKSDVLGNVTTTLGSCVQNVTDVMLVIADNVMYIFIEK